MCYRNEKSPLLQKISSLSHAARTWNYIFVCVYVCVSLSIYISIKYMYLVKLLMLPRKEYMKGFQLVTSLSYLSDLFQLWVKWLQIAREKDGIIRSSKSWKRLQAMREKGTNIELWRKSPFSKSWIEKELVEMASAGHTQGNK